jgi:lipopolysaccharide transport system permease protein
VAPELHPKFSMSRPTVYEPPALRRISLLASLQRLRQFSDLFVTLSLHRISVRYKQSRLGILWAVIQPLAMMVVFTLMFTFVRATPDGGAVALPLFVYSALLPWTMFSSGLASASGALTSHASLLTKVSFPREILPLTYVVAALIDFGLASLVLAGMMAWFGVSLSWTVGWAVLAIVVLTAFLVGLSLLVAALQVRYRDVGLAMPLLTQVWLFASPVLYPLEAVKGALPKPLYQLYLLNPLAGIVDTFRRAVVLHQLPDYTAIGVSTAIAAVLLPSAYLYFKYTELTMADTV